MSDLTSDNLPDLALAIVSTTVETVQHLTAALQAMADGRIVDSAELVGKAVERVDDISQLAVRVAEIANAKDV